MADGGGKGDPGHEYATRIDPAKENLTREQLQFIRRVEVEQWKKKADKLRGRNIATGLAIGALVAGIYTYTFFSVSQEKVLEEADEEARLARARGSGTGPR
ncbi:cytochrome c oxidase assembly factor 3 homolog, mitochondrial [Denticeps clupeoides]|uniref:Cytochrome c oxidase assembly factor 3 n=1 Tax=Denticeps clupeoides TaxID=299321 RepID=A0AAY4CQX3_9TELE|nr:cytochrome c oxidase assembly factor 3 homolog, mitochondrial [Denticeps clupeoides]